VIVEDCEAISLSDSVFFCVFVDRCCMDFVLHLSIYQALC